MRKIRAGANVDVGTLVTLLRSATRMLGRPVRSSELYDLGEEEEVNSQAPEPWNDAGKRSRRIYRTRLDGTLIRQGVIPACLAREAGVSRQTLMRLRAGEESPRVGTIRKITAAMRRMGRDVRAADLFDTGEENDGTPR